MIHPRPAPWRSRIPKRSAPVPEQIHGFDSVKEQHLENARAKEAELLAAFRLLTPTATVRQLAQRAIPPPALPTL